ncbi:MAG: helix-turn-helix domain-containing protein [Ilumatobacteraceae bacterium]
MVAHGGSLTTWQVLLSVKAGGHGKQRELARALGIEDATLTHHLNRMERPGWSHDAVTPTTDASSMSSSPTMATACFTTSSSTSSTSIGGYGPGDLDEEQALRQLLDRLRLNVAGQPATRRSGASSSVDR